MTCSNRCNRIKVSIGDGFALDTGSYLALSKLLIAFAGVVKLVDAPDSKSGFPSGSASSILASGTKTRKGVRLISLLPFLVSGHVHCYSVDARFSIKPNDF